MLGKLNILHIFNLTFSHLCVHTDNCDSRYLIEVSFLKWRCQNSINYSSVHEPESVKWSLEVFLVLSYFILLYLWDWKKVYLNNFLDTTGKTRVLSHVIPLCIPLPSRKCHCTQGKLSHCRTQKHGSAAWQEHLCSLHCFYNSNPYLWMLQSLKSQFPKDKIKFKQEDSDLQLGSW